MVMTHAVNPCVGMITWISAFPCTEQVAALMMKSVCRACASAVNF